MPSSYDWAKWEGFDSHTACPLHGRHTTSPFLPDEDEGKGGARECSCGYTLPKDERAVWSDGGHDRYCNVNV